MLDLDLFLATLKLPMDSTKPKAELIDRSAFLYLEPSDMDPEFGQCGSCQMWTGTTCTILGPRVDVDESDSCALFIPGMPSFEKEGREERVVEMREVGFASREVRCENCFYFEGKGVCGLYQKLNKSLPAVFALNEQVTSLGCCNAQTPTV